MQKFGGYTTAYIKDPTIISLDSVLVRIETYTYKEREPINFSVSGFSLAKYPHKRISGNVCEVIFHREEVPRKIHMDFKTEGKMPVSILHPKVKEGRQILYKAYFTNDMRGVI